LEMADLVQHLCMISWWIEGQGLGSQSIHIVSLIPLGCGETASHI
jgi:hypothetical protein